MIILDTNIVSEMMKQSPSQHVMQWVHRQEATDLFLTTITLAEICYGIKALPNRQNLIENAFNKVVQESFKHRILPFGEQAAFLYGKLMGHRKKLGQPLSILDGQIAAIAAVHSATLATRNIRDFENCELSLFNPFE